MTLLFKCDACDKIIQDDSKVYNVAFKVHKLMEDMEVVQEACLEVCADCMIQIPSLDEILDNYID